MESETKNQNLSETALKNSSYNFASVLILKLGGLIFTIIIARMLLPELFGIYSLALSVVTIAVVFTDFGVKRSFLRYLSESLGEKNESKSRSYIKYFLKIKGILTFLIVMILLLTSKFISYNIYEKPLLFYPLLFSCLFIIMESLKEFFGTIFFATKNLKPLPILDTFGQFSKILLSIFAILLLQDEFKITGIFIAFAISGLIHLLSFVLISYKKNKSLFIGNVTSIDKKRIWSYLGFLSIASISLAVFGSVDTLMLGKFVDAEYIAYYRVALSLVFSLVSIFSLSSVLLPIFTQIHNKRFERGFQKTFRYLMLIIIPATVGIIFVAKYLIFAIYGEEYILATFVLYFLSFLIITGPLITLYTTILESREKSKVLAKGVLISLIVNIVLNYVFIKYLLNFGQEHAIVGVGLSTVLSRILLFSILAINVRKRFNLKIRGIGLRTPIFATAIMVLVLLAFNSIINMNLFFGLVEIVLGAFVYFAVLILIKGVTKEDWKLIKGVIKK